MLMKLANEIFFWSAWVIIPLIFEIIPALGNFIVLVFRRLRIKKRPILEFLPHITLIIPVYNSHVTLYRCIQSIHESTFPNEMIEIILVDNGSKDNSFEIFQKAQLDFATLPMWWISSKQGKSKALNKAIFNSSGKYIINIDSDGILHKDALMNLVTRFEMNSDIDCMTGVILIEPELIQKTKGFLLRHFQKLEFMEYAQTFLAGRNFESQFNSIYSLSGAFSCFRKSVLLKTYLYNTNTICEDTHLTFQIKTILGKKVALCHDAIFMVDPVESFDKFYTQRQRWQIGELEVAHMFIQEKLKNPIYRFAIDDTLRLLIIDHTFAFPRLIWYFALLALGCINYSFYYIIIASVIIYGLYVFTSFLFYINVISFLKEYKEIQKYYSKKIFYLLLLPIYGMITFFIRFAGIINTITRKSSWKTCTLTEEKEMCKSMIKKDFSFIFWLRRSLKRIVEKPV